MKVGAALDDDSQGLVVQGGLNSFGRVISDRNRAEDFGEEDIASVEGGMDAIVISRHCEFRFANLSLVDFWFRFLGLKNDF